MSKQLIAEKLTEIAEQVAVQNGFELVRAAKKGAGKSLIVQVFIDKSGGISHEDCAVFSHQFGELLDAQDLIPTEYILEVSSPGLERELYSLKDFEKYVGNLAKVKTKDSLDGQKNFRGRILKVKGNEIFFEDKTRGAVNFPFEAVAKANLEIDLEEELKRK